MAYPLLGYAAGHRYPATPTFGLPCPTTWSALGVSAALQLGVPEDLGLLAAGVVSLVLAFV